MPHRLYDMNHAPRDNALAMLAPLVENAPWVAEQIVDQRPFASDEALARALVETILCAGSERRTALFRGHPELAGREAVEGRMTDESTGEQARLGLLSLDAAALAELNHLNAAYSARFGYPFIVALHRVPDIQTLFDTFARRLGACPVEEHVTTLAEIASVIRSRSTRAFGAGSSSPVTETELQD